MIARLIAWSARNLLLVLFGTGFAAAAGIYALVRLPLDAIPDLPREVKLGHRGAGYASNADVGGRTVELSEFEYVIRGKGYIKSINDLGDIVLKVNNGTPVLLRDVTRVDLGPDERRGITELNGEGEVASGIVLQRFGLNALEVIQNVKKRFQEIASSLPKMPATSGISACASAVG